MPKFKKGIAVALAAAMVLGSSMTALAEDTAPGGTGSTTGSGTSEGHVDNEKLNVVLPTVASGTTPFAYTMDPERLIQATDGAKYEDYTLPAAASDTGVYFKTGEKEFQNESNTLKVINKSSCNVTVEVKAEAPASKGANDIDLVASQSSSTTAAELYLALKAGGETKPIAYGTAATVSKTISGQPNNFETVYDKTNSKYDFVEKASPASPWKAMNLSMTGAVNNYKITEDTTAPAITVTWKWTKAAESATVDTAAEVDYLDTAAPSIASLTHTMAASTDLEIPVSLGVGSKKATGITSVVCGGETFAAGTHYTFDASTATLTFPSAMVDYWISTGVASRQVVVTFNDSEPTAVTLTIAAP